MSQTTDPEMPARSGGMVRKIAMLMGGLVLLGAGFGGGFFFADARPSPAEEVLQLIDRQAATEPEDSPEKQAKTAPDIAAFETRYYEFPEPLVTNLKASRKLMQLGIGLSTQYDAQVIANVETHSMALRSDILAVLGGVTEEQVAGKEGRDALSVTLRDTMNARLEALEGFGGIEDVFFPSFVLQ